MPKKTSTYILCVGEYGRELLEEDIMIGDERSISVETEPKNSGNASPTPGTSNV